MTRLSPMAAWPTRQLQTPLVMLQPIATAPRDGRQFLAYWPEQCFFAAVNWPYGHVMGTWRRDARLPLWHGRCIDYHEWYSFWTELPIVELPLDIA